MLDREEYVEQAYLFRTLSERSRQNIATQDLLGSIREEILATTKLPMAIDYMASELRHAGVFATAMAKLSHYFTPFQTFVIGQAESDRGKFDLALALEILRREAEYRAAGASPQGLFLYEFESISRNRLSYDKGLEAISLDPVFNDDWREWIRVVRRQVGIKEVADLVYVRSQHYVDQKLQRGEADETPEAPVLFGAKEGRIALANRGRDPMLLFAALHRHLGYPEIPRPKPVDENDQLLPTLARRVERIEARLKLMQEEVKGGIDLSKFYGRHEPPNWDEKPS